MINNLLKDLYISRFQQDNPCILQLLREMRRGENPPAYPLLLKVNEEIHYKADLKIMIMGQETDSWERQQKRPFTPIDQSSKIVASTVDDFMDTYRTFLNEWGKNSPFWHYIKNINSSLNRQLPGKTIEIIWNNIYKIGNKEKGKNRPTDIIRSFENEHFNVIEEEVNILKPDIIIFFTGPNYEKRVEKIFSITSSTPLVSSINERELAKFQLSNGITAYRTYHPNYLQQNSKVEYRDYICKDIIQSITS